MVGWRLPLGWFTVSLVVMVVLWRLLVAQKEKPPEVALFGGLMLTELGLVLVVVPALVVRFRLGEAGDADLPGFAVAAGRLLAGYGYCLVLLSTALPLVVVCLLSGEVTVARAALAMVVVATIAGVVCAVAQCFSAVCRSPRRAGVWTYVSASVLTVGTAVVFFGTALATFHWVTVSGDSRPCPEPAEPGCRMSHDVTFCADSTDRIWWVMAPNPVVVLSDAARSPAVSGRYPTDPLGSVSRWIRSARYPLTEDDFRPKLPDSPGRDMSWYPGPPIWPAGLAFDLLLAGLAFGITVRRTAFGRQEPRP